MHAPPNLLCSAPHTPPHPTPPPSPLAQLLSVLVEHCCGKELESLCACLQQLAGLLPGQVAACVGGWAEQALVDIPPEV